MNAGQKRMRIAVLWVATAVAMTYAIFLYLLVEPTALPDALTGEMDGYALDGVIGCYSTTSAILPLGMAIMALLVHTRATLWLHAVAGLLVGAWNAVDLLAHLGEGAFSAWMLVSMLGSLVLFLVAGLSFVELRQPAPSPTPMVPETTQRREQAIV